MKHIPVGLGMFAQVDDADYEWLSKRSWVARISPRNGRWYAFDSHGNPMHREIVGLKKGDPRETDHWMLEDTLNNQRWNLRIATTAQNQANRGKNRNNQSGYKGVSWHSTRQTWTAQIGVEGRNIFLGRFSSAESAYGAYCEAAKRYHGEFARVK